MMSNLKKFKPIICFGIIFSLLFVPIYSATAAKGFLGKAKEFIVENVGLEVLHAIAYLLQKGLQILGSFIYQVQSINTSLLNWTNFRKAPVVITGWNVIRDLTNMFFVFILLIIAFATILRAESYGMKQTLWKLIVAALLVNFSLVIAGVFLDFAGMLTDYFISKSGGAQNIGETIVGYLKLQKAFVPISQSKEGTKTIKVCFNTFDSCIKAKDEIENKGTSNFLGALTPAPVVNSIPGKSKCSCNVCTALSSSNPANLITSTCSTCSNFLSWTTARGELICEIPKDSIAQSYKEDFPDDLQFMASLIGNMLVSGGLLFIALLVLAVFGFFLLVRIIILWVLLIISPLAWLLWVLPDTQRFFREWWDTFLKWTFFAPIYSFFVWLTLTTWIQIINSSGYQQATANLNNQYFNDRYIPALSTSQNLLQFVLLLGLLVGGLIAAQKLSIYGAQGAMGFVQKYSGYSWGRKKIPETTKGIIKAPGRAALKKWVPTRMPVLGPMAAEARKQKAEQIDKEADKMKLYTTKDLQSFAKRSWLRRLTSKQKLRTAAAIKVLSERTEGLTNFTADEIKAMAKFYEKQGKSAKDIYKRRPDVLPKEEQKNLILSLSPKEKAKLLSSKVFTEKGAVDRLAWLTPEDIKEISKNGSYELKKALKELADKLYPSTKQAGRVFASNVKQNINQIINDPSFQVI